MLSRKVNQSRFTTLATVLLLLLSAATSKTSAEETEPPLLTLKEFCEMDRTTVAKRSIVRIRGTIIFCRPEWDVAFIQDAECAVKVYMKTKADLKFGQTVELTGHTEFGNFSNILTLTEVRVLGEGKVSFPAKPGGTKPLALDQLYSWTEIEGPVFSGVSDDKYYYLHVAGKEFGFYVHLPRSPELPPIEEMKNGHIRVRGVPTITLRGEKPFRNELLVPDEETLELVPSDNSENEIQLRSIAAIDWRDMKGDTETPARIRAVVQSVFPPGRLIVSDQTGSLYAELDDTSIVELPVPGDVIEITGRVNRTLKHHFVQDAEILKLGRGYSNPPVEINAKHGQDYISRLIRTKGTLVASNHEKNWLLLNRGHQYFRVVYKPEHSSRLQRAGPGSQISVTGGCWMSPSDDSAFDILAQDVEVLFQIDAPPSESDDPTVAATAREATTENATPPREVIKPALLILLLIFVGTLIYLVNRRLKEQERFQESIHEQLSNLSHIARLNTLSEMVGALAHELNQPLSSVANYAATAEVLSQREPAGSEKLAGVLTSIGQEAFRAGEIIRRLRHLVRKKTPGSLPVHVSEIIRETVELFKTQHVTASGLVQVDVPDDLPAVQADSVQIQQVVLNLLLNARDATEAQPDRTSAIQVETSFEEGMVCVTVSDNGIGIASETPDAIFEPYFTTREKGTGLGLAISRTIIETHGGKITAENGSPFGTRITFSLPVSRSQTHIAG